MNGMKGTTLSTLNVADDLGTLNWQLKGYPGYHIFTKETRFHWATYTNSLIWLATNPLDIKQTHNQKLVGDMTYHKIP